MFLPYNCFVCKNSIKTHTHSGVKSLFALTFIKEGKIEAKWGKLLVTLFDKRQEGDYGDFVYLTEAEIKPLVQEVEAFRLVILDLLKD